MALAPSAVARADGGGGGDGGDGSQLQGMIESLPATTGFVGDWIVSGTTVHVTAATEVDAEDGVIAIGSSVEAEGTVEIDGSFTATKVEVHNDAEDDQFGQVELLGTVQSMPATTGFVGDWVISGTTVHVTATTEVDAESGTPSVGAFVEVKGMSESDGSITASKIEVREDQGDDHNNDAALTGTLQQAGGVPGTWRVARHE